MSTKSKGTSVTQKLLGVSKRLGTVYSNVVTVFLIERLVSRLVADKTLRKNLVFKGGFVGLKVYDSPRYTVDLDALLVKANLEKTLMLCKENAELDFDDGVWFRFEKQIDLLTQGEYGGIRQTYRAGIGEVPKNLKKAQIVNFDLGIGDPVVPAPVQAKTPSLVLPEELSWSVYPIETIIAEKLHAIIARGDANSRSKDIHDLAIFLPKAERSVLQESLKKCFAYRETELPDGFAKALKALDTSMLERGWAKATASVKDAPEFQATFNTLVAQISDFERGKK